MKGTPLLRRALTLLLVKYGCDVSMNTRLNCLVVSISKTTAAGSLEGGVGGSPALPWRIGKPKASLSLAPRRISPSVSINFSDL